MSALKMSKCLRCAASVIGWTKSLFRHEQMPFTLPKPYEWMPFRNEGHSRTNAIHERILFTNECHSLGQNQYRNECHSGTTAIYERMSFMRECHSRKNAIHERTPFTNEHHSLGQNLYKLWRHGQVAKGLHLKLCETWRLSRSKAMYEYKSQIGVESKTWKILLDFHNPNKSDSRA